MPLHSNEARTHGKMSKLENRSFVYDRRSTDAPKAEVLRSLWSQKISQNFRKWANYSQVAAARSHLKLRWRPLAAAEAGAAASGGAGMPVRWPRRPAAVSEAAVADAEPDFSCAGELEQPLKALIGEVRSLSVVCVCVSGLVGNR